MEHRATIPLCIALVSLLCAGVIAVAPGDQQSQCITTGGSDSPGRALVNAYTRRQKPLMDMYWYALAFGNFGNGIWESIKGSNGYRGAGWRRGQITLCRSTMQARQHGNSNEDNWIATQFISTSTASAYDLPIFVNVTYRFLSCEPKRFGLYYYPSATQPSSSSKQNTDNYMHIGDVVTNTRTQQTKSFSFNLGSQFRGFHLAFRDQDSCGAVQRVQVYRGTCPQRTEGLVRYPETPTGIAAVSVTHQCAANANINGRGLMCNPDGSWSGSPSCSCVPGHTRNRDTCQVCAAGTYQSGDSCVRCPANTVTNAVGVTACSCQNGYYRAPSDPSSAGCTEPPARVQQLQATQSTNTTITLQWSAPTNTGGRSDLVYQISYRRIGSEQIMTSSTTQTTHKITGLQPLSEYRIRVVSANGITLELVDVAAITLDSRTAEITSSTTEGVPGPPARVNVVGCTVIWQPPQTPNGNLVGYTIRVYPDGNVEQAQIINVGTTDMYHQLSASSLPAGDNLLVQVRGRTSIGGGEWSVANPLSSGSCSMSAPVAQCPEPSTVTVTVTPSPVVVPCSVSVTTTTHTVEVTSTVTLTLSPTPVACPTPPPVTLPPPVQPIPPRQPIVQRRVIKTSVGNISTPSYPSQAYPNNADYHWVIQVPDVSKAVQLTFHGMFDIEHTAACNGSYLEVRDGDSQDSILVGRFCGSVPPSPINSSTNSLYIHFHSTQNMATNIGFSATFKTVDGPAGLECGSTIILPQDKFGFGRTFPAVSSATTPQRCTYLIGNIGNGKNVNFRVLYTDLKNCSQGMIEVYTGLFPSERSKIATICSAEDAQQVITVPHFIMNIVYTVKVPGLRGLVGVLGDECSDGQQFSREGKCKDSTS